MLFFLRLKQKIKKNKLEFSNIIWLTLDKLIKLFVGLFIGVYVARYLGPSDYGKLNLAKAIYIVLTPLSLMGLQQIIVREVINRPYKQNHIVCSGIILSFLGSLFSTFLLLIISYFLVQDDKLLKSMLFILSFAYLFKPIQVLSYVFEAKIKSKYNVLSINIAVVISGLFKLFLVYINANTMYFAYSIVIDSLIYSLVLFLFSFKSKIIGVISYSLNEIKLLIAFSWPLIIASFSILIYMQIDKVMIGVYLTSKDVGIYSAASQISEIFYFIPVMLSNTIFPYLNKLKTSSSVKFDLEFIKINRYFMLISMLIIVPIVIFSRSIVLLLFGDDFIESSNILNIHIIGLLFVFFGVIGSKWILINNFQQITMYKTLIGMVVNLILNFIFIPALGIIGCACATVISQIFSGYILNLISYKTRELFILQSKALIPFYGK